MNTNVDARNKLSVASITNQHAAVEPDHWYGSPVGILIRAGDEVAELPLVPDIKDLHARSAKKQGSVPFQLGPCLTFLQLEDTIGPGEFYRLVMNA